MRGLTICSRVIKMEVNMPQDAKGSVPPSDSGQSLHLCTPYSVDYYPGRLQVPEAACNSTGKYISKCSLL